MLREQRVFVVISINIAFAICFVTISQLQEREEFSTATATVSDEWKRKQTYTVHVNKMSSREDDSAVVEIVSFILAEG